MIVETGRDILHRKKKSNNQRYIYIYILYIVIYKTHTMIRASIALLLIVNAAYAATTQNVVLNRDVKLTKSFTAESFKASSMNVSGTLSVEGEVTASRVKAAMLTADVVETGTLSPKAGDTIIIEGDLELSGSSDKAAQGVSFLEAQELVLGGTKQWRIVAHDTFNQDTKGWNVAETSTCGTSNVFLGGNCQQTIAKKGAEKIYTNLPTHSEIRLKARFHFLDKWVDGDTAYAKINDEYAWIDTPGANAGKINVCGDKHPEAGLSQLLDVVQTHNSNTVKINFGAFMSENDACKQSWGVDDVEIYVK